MSNFLFDCAIAHKARQGALLNPLAILDEDGKPILDENNYQILQEDITNNNNE